MEAHTGNDVPVREYLLRIIADQDTRWSQLAEAQATAVQAALVAQEKAVQAALAAADKAVAKAEEGATAWRVSANEWRGAMSDRERTFITRTEYDQGMKAMTEKVEMLRQFADVATGQQHGRSDMAGWIVGGVMFLIAVVGFVIDLTRPVR